MVLEGDEGGDRVSTKRREEAKRELWLWDYNSDFEI